MKIENKEKEREVAKKEVGNITKWILYIETEFDLI
jgi:hypothetical protein